MTEQAIQQPAQPNSGAQNPNPPAPQQTPQPSGQPAQDHPQKPGQQQAPQPSDKKEPDTKAQTAPDKYEFKAPEGQQFDPKFVEVYSEAAREIELSQEKAQKLIDKMSPVLEQQQIAKIEAVRTEWTEASKIDKEFGGDKLEENLGIAKVAIDKFATKELKDFLNITGAGNHPEFIRFCYRVGKEMSADTFVGGRKEGTPGPKNFNDLAAKLYT